MALPIWTTRSRMRAFPLEAWFGLQRLMASRCVRQSGAYSAPFDPTRSIVQGLRAGTRFAKCATYYIMAKITTVHVGMSHRLWIDDLSQTYRASRRTMVAKMVHCLADTCQAIQEAGLKVSPKSVVLCTRLCDAKLVARKLKTKGYHINAVGQTAYLGGDMGGGKRHARATRTTRAIKHAKMSKKVLQYARATRRYGLTSRLEQQGAQPAGTYCHQLHGIFGQQMLQVRRNLANAVSPRLTGRCLTTLLDLRAHGQDPAYKMPVGCLRLWLSCWTKEPHIRAGINQSWPRLAQEFMSLPPARRHRLIRGPQGAVISYLLEAGWNPVSPSDWQTPSDNTGAIDSWQFKVEDLTGISNIDVPQEFFY